MLTMIEAREIAIANLPDPGPRIELVIMDEHTIAKPYGWVFFFNSKQFLETGDVNYAIGGNGPVVVRHNGRWTMLGSQGDVDKTIADFERQHWLSLKLPF